MSRTLGRSASPRNPLHSSHSLSRRSVLGGTAAAAAALGLAACGGDSGSGSDSSDALIMTVWGGENDKKAYQARLDLAAKKYPDIKVTLQLIPSDNYAQKVQTMISSGTGPDIMQVAEDVNVYSSKSQLFELDKYISDGGLDLDSTYGPAGKLYVYEDKTYGIPDRSGAMVTYFNKDLFDAKGVEYPTGDWNWDTFTDAAVELNDPDNGVWGYSGFGWWPQWFSLIEQNGGHVIDLETGKPTVNSPEALEAMEFIYDLMFTKKVIPTQADYQNMGTDIGADGAFQQGKLAMDSTGFWLVGGNAAIDGLNWDLAPFMQGKQKAVSAFGSALTIPKAAKNPANSYKIIEFLTGEEGQAPIASQGQDVPANVNVQNSDTFLKPEWNTTNADIDLQAFPDSADMIFTAPFIPQWNELQDACTNALADYWLGKKEAKASLDDLQSRLESIVK